MITESPVAQKLVGSYRDYTDGKRKVKRVGAAAGRQGLEVVSSEVSIKHMEELRS